MTPPLQPEPAQRARGSDTIREWIELLLGFAGAGHELRTSGGADPGRSYAYLALNVPAADYHAVLLFSLREGEGAPRLVTHLVQGSGSAVQAGVRARREVETLADFAPTPSAA